MPLDVCRAIRALAVLLLRLGHDRGAGRVGAPKVGVHIVHVTLHLRMLRGKIERAHQSELWVRRPKQRHVVRKAQLRVSDRAVGHGIAGTLLEPERFAEKRDRRRGVAVADIGNDTLRGRQAGRFAAARF